MIVETFDKKSSLIIVPVTVKVDSAIKKLFFALDTGATITMIDSDAIRMLGYTEANSTGITNTVTASKTETVHEYTLHNFMSLGLIRRNFKVISRSLPLGLGIDGLLGLNFFKYKELTIDFKIGEIRIS